MMTFTMCNGKAIVSDEGGVKVLTSYSTEVARIEGDKVTLLEDWDYSMTTIKHVREFLDSKCLAFQQAQKPKLKRGIANE